MSRGLEATRQAALEAASSGDRDTDGRLEGQWIGHFVGLLGEHPEAADDLRRLLEGFGRFTDGQRISGGVRLEARADGNGRVYQAVRDQHITER